MFQVMKGDTRSLDPKLYIIGGKKGDARCLDPTQGDTRSLDYNSCKKHDQSPSEHLIDVCTSNYSPHNTNMGSTP